VAWQALIALAGAGALTLGGIVSALPRGLRAGLIAQTAGTTLLGAAGAAVLFGGDPVGATFHSDVAPALGLDPLSGFFLLVLALTAVPALVFAHGYLPGSPGARAVAPLTAAFVLALAGLLAARDVTGMLASWELMTLVPAAAILAARRDKPVRDAVYAYVAITHLGGVGVWIALLVLAQHGALGDPTALHGGAQTLVAVSALVGFGTKAGFVPLHSWLPRAHPVAPAHLSALMSGVMIKVALYGLIRVEFEWLGATPRWLGLVLLTVGLVSAIAGVLWALVQPDLKRVLAFSSIENVGLVALGLGASLLFARAGAHDWAAFAFAAALLQVACHALFKALLFLCAGAFERAVGSLQLDELGGLLRRMPWTGGTFLLGCAAIAGLPPLCGFASEWLLLQSLLHLALDGPLGVALAAALALAGLALTIALAVLCFVKVAGLVLLGPARREETALAKDAAPAMRVGMAGLAGTCVLLGVLPGLVLPTLAGLAPGAAPQLTTQPGLNVPGTGSLPVLALAVALLALTALLAGVRGSRRAAPAPTWACGQPLVPALNWTSAAFTKPLRLVLESVLRPTRELDVDGEPGLIRGITYRSEVPSLVDRALLDPAIDSGLRGAAFARRLQTGNVRTYAFYLLALVLGLLALVRIGALG
jgi:formate hydrogenlyase subunit 3/multisubunit Na+/H+ antiporter MnhD subunit